MKNLPLRDTDLVRFANAAEILDTGAGLVPLRFPQAVTESFARYGMMREIARYATGIELRLQGDFRQTAVHCRVLSTDGWGVFADLHRGAGKVLPTHRLDPADRRSQVLRWSPAPDEVTAGPWRVLLPTHCEVEILRIEVDENAEAETVADWDYTGLGERAGLTWIAHGDSITQGANVTAPSATWVDMTARILGLRPVNLGIGGFGKMEPEMAAYLASRIDADLLTLHVGVNCVGGPTEDDFARQFDAFIATIRAARPALPIVTVSPLYSYRDERGDDKSPRAFRRAQACVCAARNDSGDTRLWHIDGLSLNLREEHLRADRIHLAEYGAACFTQAFCAALRPILASLASPA